MWIGKHHTVGRHGRCTTKNFYLFFTDHLGRPNRKLPLPRGMDRRLAEAVGRKVQALITHRIAGEQPSPELMKWLENTPPQMRQRLVFLGLLDPARAAVGKPLLQYVEEYREALGQRKKTAKDNQQVIHKITEIIKGCKFVMWSDVTATAVGSYLQKRREDQEDPLAPRTSNHYLTAMKSFTKWMVANKLATDDPLTAIESLRIDKTDERHPRAPLEPEEVRRLIRATRKEPVRFGMTGEERALLYLFAIETGMRADGIRSLTVSSLDLDKRSVTLLAGRSKNRREVIVPLLGKMIADLRVLTARRLPGTKLFGGTYKVLTPETAEMLRQDLAATAEYDAAGKLLWEAVPEKTARGEFRDFHALRHTGYTWLENLGVPRKIIADIFGQKTLKMGDIYSHPEWYRMRDAVDQFAELDRVIESETEWPQHTGLESA